MRRSTHTRSHLHTCAAHTAHQCVVVFSSLVVYKYFLFVFKVVDSPLLTLTCQFHRNFDRVVDIAQVEDNLAVLHPHTHHRAAVLVQLHLRLKVESVVHMLEGRHVVHSNGLLRHYATDHESLTRDVVFRFAVLEYESDRASAEQHCSTISEAHSFVEREVFHFTWFLCTPPSGAYLFYVRRKRCSSPYDFRH